MTAKLTTSAGVPASRASHPVQVSGRVPSSVRGAPSDPTASVTVSTTRNRRGNSRPVSRAEQTTVSAAGWAESTLTSRARVKAMSIMASRGCRMRMRIGRLPSPKTRLARASSSRLTTDVAEGSGPFSVARVAGVASSRHSNRAWKTQRTSRR
jgi:hypothetical protein